MIALQPPQNIPDSLRLFNLTMGRHQWQFTTDVNKPTQRYIHDILMDGQVYELLSTRILGEVLESDDVFFDVGANCGWFSAMALAHGARVVAFEPDIENCIAFRRNCPSAELIAAAVGDRDGKIQLFRNLDNDGGHALWNPGAHPWNKETRAETPPASVVPCVTLDSFAIYQPAAIKIDTEGAEWHVLMGAKEILSRPNLHLVICERNAFGLEQMGHKPEEIEALMKDAGFFIREEPDCRTVDNWIFVR